MVCADDPRTKSDRNEEKFVETYHLDLQVLIAKRCQKAKRKGCLIVLPYLTFTLFMSVISTRNARPHVPNPDRQNETAVLNSGSETP